MPDAKNTDSSPAQGADEESAQGAAAQAQGAPQQPEAGAAESSGGTDVGQLQAKVAELERDNLKYRAAAREREEAERQSQEAKLSEAERQSRHFQRLETENADLLRQLQEERTRGRVIEEATKAGFNRPSLAWRLIDLSSVEYDKTGRPQNVDKLVSGILKDMPELASSTARATGSVEGGVRGTGATGAAGGPQDMNRLIRQAAGRT